MIPFGAVLKKSPYSAVRAQPPKALPYHQDPDTKFPTRLDVNGGGIRQAVPVSVGVILPILFPPGLGFIFDKEVSKRLKSHPHLNVHHSILVADFADTFFLLGAWVHMRTPTNPYR